MIRTLSKVAIAACRLAKHDPADVITRAHPSEHWLVAVEPIMPDVPVHWSTVSDGDLVHVPLYAHLTVDDPADAIAYAAGLGALALAQVDTLPVQLHIAYGDCVEETTAGDANPTNPQQRVFQFYFGLAVRVI